MATAGKLLSDDTVEKTIRSHESPGNLFHTQKLTAQSPAGEAIQFIIYKCMVIDCRRFKGTWCQENYRVRNYLLDMRD